MTGEARVDARGLAIHDQTQGWTLRVGEISREMYLSRAEMLAAEEDRSPEFVAEMWFDPRKSD